MRTAGAAVPPQFTQWCSLSGQSSGSGCNGRNPCWSTFTRISSANPPCDFGGCLLRRLPAVGLVASDLLLYQRANCLLLTVLSKLYSSRQGKSSGLFGIWIFACLLIELVFLQNGVQCPLHRLKKPLSRQVPDITLLQAAPALIVLIRVLAAVKRGISTAGSPG